MSEPDAMQIGQIVLLTDMVSKLLTEDEKLKELIGDDKELRDCLFDKIGNTAWAWYCEISKGNYISIDVSGGD